MDGDTVLDDKSAWDVLRSKRFISFVIYLSFTYVLFPIGVHFVPSVFGSINPNMLIENTTTVILMLIGGYSTQDALTALRNKTKK